jgi:PAS domain S-box-containing protein
MGDARMERGTMSKSLSSRVRTGTQLRALLQVMDRLNAGDTGVEIPYLQDSTEIGRMADALEAFRRRVIEAEEERVRSEQASAAVRESEARHRMLADNTGDIIIQYDLDFTPLYISPSVVKLLGRHPDELRTLPPSEVVHPDDLAEMAERRADAKAGLPVKPAAGRLRAADGSWKWVERTLTQLIDDDGQRVGFVTTIRDIGERKLAEQALVDSESRYRMLADNTRDIVIQYDLDFRPLYVSPSVKSWGYAPDQVLAEGIVGFVNPEDLPLVASRRAAAQQGRPVDPVIGSVRTADGNWIWVESTITPMYDQTGVRVGFISTFRDVSLRMIAQQALVDSEARYRMLAENVTDVLLYYGRDLRIEYCSPSVRHWGYEPEDFVGQAAGFFVHPEDETRINGIRAAVLRGERVPSVECRVRRADGSYFWIESNPSLIRDESGGMAGMVLVLRDISARKAAEQALVDSEARYRMLAENITDVMLHYDANEKITYVSPSVRQWGYAPDDLLGKPSDHFIHPDDRARIAPRRAALLRGEEGSRAEARILLADGGWAWVESSPSPVRGPDQSVVGVVLILRDISARKAAEAALVDSEVRYRMLADNVTDVLVRYGPQGWVDYVSPSIRQWGYAVEDFIDTPAGYFVHPEDRAVIAARREAWDRGEPPGVLDYRIRRADGSWVWVESNPAVIRDDANRVVSVVLVLRDISARKAAEQALVDSETQFRLLAENITDVMLRYNLDGRISYVSPSVRQWGYQPSDFIGKIAGHLIHPDDEARIVLRRDAMLAGEEAPRIEVRILRADGKWTWIESNPSLIRDERGTVVGVVLIMRDINQRKLAEAALIESEARYRILADNTSDIIQRFDADGLVQYISPSVRQLGYEPEFFLGRPTAQLVEREDLPAVARRREAMLSGRPVPPMESRVRTADGRTVWLESRPSPILGEDGALVGVVNVMRDVTERKNAENALQALNLELRRVARASALGAFAASLAHEINQPLAAAAASGEAALRWLSAETPNYDRGLQAVGRAVEAVRRAADVIGGLRALVTKEEPNRAPFDMHDAIGEVLALTAPEGERSSVTVRTRLEAAEPVTDGDRVQFQQVMINLVLNAIEAMRETEGERLLIVGSRDGADSLELFVEDRGPGISPDQQPLIFESMFTTKIGGTGLGLAIAKSIVESHGGAISMTPATPHGAVFWVRLPRPEAETRRRRRTQ